MPVNPPRFEGTSLLGAHFQEVNPGNSSFSDVSLVAAKLHDIKLSKVTITDANLDGMTIDGILVTELLRAYRA